MHSPLAHGVRPTHAIELDDAVVGPAVSRRRINAAGSVRPLGASKGLLKKIRRREISDLTLVRAEKCTAVRISVGQCLPALRQAANPSSNRSAPGKPDVDHRHREFFVHGARLGASALGGTGVLNNEGRG